MSVISTPRVAVKIVVEIRHFNMYGIGSSSPIYYTVLEKVSRIDLKYHISLGFHGPAVLAALRLSGKSGGAALHAEEKQKPGPLTFTSTCY